MSGMLERMPLPLDNCERPATMNRGRTRCRCKSPSRMRKFKPSRTADRTVANRRPVDLRNGHPFGSHVPLSAGQGVVACLALHLSCLALHTQHLLKDSRVSLFIAEPDEPEKTPGPVNVWNLMGTVSSPPVGHDAYESVKNTISEEVPPPLGSATLLLWGAEDVGRIWYWISPARPIRHASTPRVASPDSRQKVETPQPACSGTPRNVSGIPANSALQH